MQWTSAVSLAASNSQWRQDFEDARQRVNGEAPSRPLSSSESVACHHISGYKVVKLYNFVTEAEFAKTYAVKPSDLNLQVDSIIDEHGREMKGVLMFRPHTPEGRALLLCGS